MKYKQHLRVISLSVPCLAPPVNATRTYTRTHTPYITHHTATSLCLRCQSRSRSSLLSLSSTLYLKTIIQFPHILLTRWFCAGYCLELAVIHFVDVFSVLFSNLPLIEGTAQFWCSDRFWCLEFPEWSGWTVDTVDMCCNKLKMHTLYDHFMRYTLYKSQIKSNRSVYCHVHSFSMQWNFHLLSAEYRIRG